MRCKYCQRTDSLLTMPYEDEDGFKTDELINLCEFCVEHDVERSRARAEWNHYHDERCPESELPQPAPKD